MYTKSKAPELQKSDIFPSDSSNFWCTLVEIESITPSSSSCTFAKLHGDVCQGTRIKRLKFNFIRKRCIHDKQPSLVGGVATISMNTVLYLDGIQAKSLRMSS